MPVSILDRLVASRPSPGGSRAVGREDVAEGLRRDLENLLNTRSHFGVTLAADWPECATSVLGYGLADAEDCLLSSTQEVEGLRANVLRAIELYEPRLTGVEVRVLAAPKPNTHDVVLEIRGVVRVNAEEIAWSSTLRGATVIVGRDG